MAILKRLCGVALSAGVLTDVYTAPKECVMSTLVVCNRGSTSTTFRLAHSPAGVAIANGHYFAYDSMIKSNTTVPFTLGICMAPADVLRAYAGNAELTVLAWGEEQA